jgi:hypothetical protein
MRLAVLLTLLITTVSSIKYLQQMPVVVCLQLTYAIEEKIALMAAMKSIAVPMNVTVIHVLMAKAASTYDWDISVVHQDIQDHNASQMSTNVQWLMEVVTRTLTVQTLLAA